MNCRSAPRLFKFCGSCRNRLTAPASRVAGVCRTCRIYDGEDPKRIDEEDDLFADVVKLADTKERAAKQIEMPAISAVPQADAQVKEWWRRYAVGLENERRALNENLSAVQERCSTLLLQVRELEKQNAFLRGDLEAANHRANALYLIAHQP